MLTEHAIIDSHQHFWEPARGDYGWLQPTSSLYRAFAPADLIPLLKATGVQGSILVQAAPTIEETHYLLGLARIHPWIVGVIGWMDLAAADAVEQIESYREEPLFVGVRPMLQDMPDRAWILKPQLEASLNALRIQGLVMDALVHADQLPTLAALADRHPNLSIVLDHAGKPPFSDIAALAEWHVNITALSKRANVACKLSGLVTELPIGVAHDSLDCYVDALLDCFGPDRLLWGSDWPVATTAVDYAGWLERCQARVASRLPAGGNAIFGDNARRIYRLGGDRNIYVSEA